MKQCPRCKKEVAEHAKVCPYCGYRLDMSYQSMKRKNAPAVNIIYVIVACIFIFSPAIFGYFFSASDLSSNSLITEDGPTITLGKIGDVKNVQEYIDYQFDDLEIFNKRVSDVEDMVTNIKDFEKEIETIVDRDFDKEHTIIITDQQNIYYDLTYTIHVNDNDYFTLRLYYDMAKVTNTASIISYRQNRIDFNEIAYQEEDYSMMQKLVALVQDKDTDTLLQKTGEKFNTLDSMFEQRKKSLGHYGIGINNIEKDVTCSMYVNGYVDNYTVKLEYQTKLNLKKFI